ncbi:MAG TPA: L,D-transpeptidase family protein [Vicinamibacterales bacterium]|nr:L,D-transpeptidase family protein [Vicinamibacterales bacterium]
MRPRTVQLAVWLTAAALFAAAAPPQHAPIRRTPHKRAVVRKPPEPPPLECGDYVGFQVLLDRQGFSTGEIDGRPGTNLTRAITAMQNARGLPVTGQPDCDAWHALGGDHAPPPLMDYTISDDDVNGPFSTAIPRELAQQSSLPALGYRTPLELLAERFHLSPALLEKLNDDVTIAAGQRIQVPAVTPFLADEKPAPDPAVGDVTILVSREESALRATRADGPLVFYAPVTTGSEHDPLPVGDWKVLGVQWHPVFHYNPNLFWDAKPTDSRADIKPGPNNPVGVVWVALSKEHYGLHGTPEPGHIGHTESHGCVRLTNWDAARVASLVQPGTPVLFR